MMCGGLGAAQDCTDEVKAFCLEVRDELEAKVGRKFEIYEPKQYKSQVVAGTNYFVKIQVGTDGECVHVRMYQPLPFNKPEDSNVLFHGHLSGLNMDHNVEYFEKK